MSVETLHCHPRGRGGDTGIKGGQGRDAVRYPPAHTTALHNAFAGPKVQACPGANPGVVQTHNEMECSWKSPECAVICKEGRDPK